MNRRPPPAGRTNQRNTPPRHRPDAAASPLPAGSLGEALSVASDALKAVLEGFALNDGLAGLWQAYPELSPATRGAVQDLLYGTLRDFGRGQAILARLLNTPLAETRITALLLVALHRLEVRPDTAHTVVDQTVEAASRLAGGGFKGLVNGVLRNALRTWPQIVAALDEQEVSRWRHPAWWIASVRRNWPQDWPSILGANNAHPPMSLRINRLRGSAVAYRSTLESAGMAFEDLDEYALRLMAPCPVAQLPGYSEGLVTVQDWGAQQAAALLDLHDGQRVLDACAAPGGKTGAIAESAKVELLALELEPARAQRVRDTLVRLGLSAEVRTVDCRDTEAWWDGRSFDRILADVPCSASGVARRHPDIKWLRRPEDVVRFATIQAEILEALWITLAPGGKMLYLTCSLFPEENSAQLAGFAARHRDCVRAPFPDGSIERQLLPSSQHDGFYFALLEKTVR
ncbi:MAG: rRNA ((967)-C(5))-methyltransferase RsmB [Pseudomonadota bacterium]